MSEGVELKMGHDLQQACHDGKYILIVKRPKSKSRIHTGKCRLLELWHNNPDYIAVNHKLGTGKAKQKYYMFDSLKEAKNEYPARVRVIDPFCQFCIKEEELKKIGYIEHEK